MKAHILNLKGDEEHPSYVDITLLRMSTHYGGHSYECFYITCNELVLTINLILVHSKLTFNSFLVKS
jgi:hypothetical protein